MTLIENEKKQEMLAVTFDKLRRMGSFSGWQRQLYNFIIDRLGATHLQKIISYINSKIENVVPEDVNPEDIKDTIKLAFIDYIDSVL